MDFTKLLLVMTFFLGPFVSMASITADQKAFFEQNGYLIVPGLFDEVEVSQIKAIAMELKERSDELAKRPEEKILDNGALFMIERPDGQARLKLIAWAAGAKPELLTFGRSEKLAHIVSDLLETEEADHIINQLHYKLPRDKVSFPWHQDIRYRKMFDPNWADVTGKGSFVQTLTAVDPNNISNGPLYVIPGSHKQGDLSLEQYSNNEVEQKISLNQALPLLMSPGDVAFMHPYLIHGSSVNESEESRVIFINGFSAPGANHKPYPGIGSAQRIKLKT